MLWYSPAFLFRKFFISSHIHTTKDYLSFAYIHFSAAFSQSFLVFTVSFCHERLGKGPHIVVVLVVFGVHSFSHSRTVPRKGKSLFLSELHLSE
jgi:hypothetical protein